MEELHIRDVGRANNQSGFLRVVDTQDTSSIVIQRDTVAWDRVLASTRDELNHELAVFGVLDLYQLTATGDALLAFGQVAFDPIVTQQAQRLTSLVWRQAEDPVDLNCIYRITLGETLLYRARIENPHSLPDKRHYADKYDFQFVHDYFFHINSPVEGASPLARTQPIGVACNGFPN